MTNEDEILKEAHEYAAALDRREERKEVYLRVAAACIRYSNGYKQEGDMGSWVDGYFGWDDENVDEIAEAIYQGMIKFAGEIK
jgi:hypothetical protein